MTCAGSRLERPAAVSSADDVRGYTLALEVSVRASETDSDIREGSVKRQ